MTALIAELTELARGEEQQPEPEDVRLDLVTEDAIRRTTRNHPERPIRRRARRRRRVVGVPATLERAIANLLDNAAKWSPPGGDVEVRLARRRADRARPRARDRRRRPAARLRPLLPRDRRRASMPGSGLGLAIVRQVAEAHGGTVVAERAPRAAAR